MIYQTKPPYNPQNSLHSNSSDFRSPTSYNILEDNMTYFAIQKWNTTATIEAHERQPQNLLSRLAILSLALYTLRCVCLFIYSKHKSTENRAAVFISILSPKGLAQEQGHIPAPIEVDAVFWGGRRPDIVDTTTEGKHDAPYYWQ
jgi:hypothetical protein